MNNEPDSNHNKDDEDDDAIVVPDKTSAIVNNAVEPDENKSDEDSLDVDNLESSDSESDVTDSDSDDTSTLPVMDDDDEVPQTVEFDETVIPLAGETNDSLVSLLVDAEKKISTRALDEEVRTVGSWANVIFRMRSERSAEELRTQMIIASLPEEQRQQLSQVGIDRNGNKVFTSSVLRDKDNKVQLKTSRLAKKFEPGSVTTLTGADALLAFESKGQGGGYRIPLYNSGLTIDLMAPTGNDIQTLLYNCSQIDRELGSRLGAHYFAYSDIMYKTQILNFIGPLIIGSSYIEWKSRDKLFSAIKINDLPAIIATLAAICYPDGYSEFAVTCKRPIDPDPKVDSCNHIEKINADIFKMIVTRFSSMSEEAINHMTQARVGNSKHNVVTIAKYQSDLGYEGEKLTFDKLSLVMRIPSLTEHLEAGAQFLADIVSEIEGNDTTGREEQLGLRYIRTFLPWIAEVELVNENNSIVKTSDRSVISRVLENIEHQDTKGKFIESLEDYVGRTQLTYVGHPILPCSKCGYVTETPSGMWTIDPFTSFFTLALQYLQQNVFSETDSGNT